MLCRELRSPSPLLSLRCRLAPRRARLSALLQVTLEVGRGQPAGSTVAATASALAAASTAVVAVAAAAVAADERGRVLRPLGDIADARRHVLRAGGNISGSVPGALRRLLELRQHLLFEQVRSLLGCVPRRGARGGRDDRHQRLVRQLSLEVTVGIALGLLCHQTLRSATCRLLCAGSARRSGSITRLRRRERATRSRAPLQPPR